MEECSDEEKLGLVTCEPYLKGVRNGKMGMGEGEGGDLVVSCVGSLGYLRLNKKHNEGNDLNKHW